MALVLMNKRELDRIEALRAADGRAGAAALDAEAPRRRRGRPNLAERRRRAALQPER